MDANGVYAVEPVASFASLVNDKVHMVLHLPKAPPAADSATLRLRTGSRVVRCEATLTTVTDGVLVEASVPASKLVRGTWRLSLRPDGDTPAVRLQARLVTSPHQPVALLTGPAARTQMAPPKPRRRPGGQSTSRARRVARRVVDTALAPLPDPSAARVRSLLVRVAGRARVRS